MRKGNITHQGWGRGGDRHLPGDIREAIQGGHQQTGIWYTYRESGPDRTELPEVAVRVVEWELAGSYPCPRVHS